ncbi:Junctophilin-3 [Trichinella zimbabwensis]|uniref:Junctophilin-3 n=1 Tax=Trichinella zimbabwensis TaxID=268475 RepID=A0A0V1GZL8_9BILA|nr:Junctophilin-3 [Trichinella zimbabwensis]
MNGGRFDFDDGGTYCGGWEDGKAHGHGVCTGPKGQGEYSGAWHYGFEVSGVYAWPSGNTYDGQWQNGKRHGLGVERRGRWVYRGEWTQGYKGRYGVRHSTSSNARYTGTWANGLQDGYGTENYADGGTYQGQWLRGMRHGYGVRKSAAFSVAAKYRSRSHAHASLTSLRSNQDTEEDDDKDKRSKDENRGGFVLRARSEPPTRRRSLSERSIAVKRTIFQGLRIKKQKSTGDIVQRITNATGSIRSSGSTVSWGSDESAWTGYSGSQEHESLMYLEFVDPNANEVYMGEWKNDKRSGYGVCERSDGLKYEGEWYNNKKFGYGVTTFKDGTKEEGKYKNNILLTSQRKKHLLFVRSSKLRERIDSAVAAANRAAQIAVQKADIALARTVTADDRAEQADLAMLQAQEDSDIARICAKQFAPDFHQPGTEILKKYRHDAVASNYSGQQYNTASRAMSPNHRGHRSRSLYPGVPSQSATVPVHNTQNASTNPHPQLHPSHSNVLDSTPSAAINSLYFENRAHTNYPMDSSSQGSSRMAPSTSTATDNSQAQYVPSSMADSHAANQSTSFGLSEQQSLHQQLKPVRQTSTQHLGVASIMTQHQDNKSVAPPNELSPVNQAELPNSSAAVSRTPSHCGSKHSLNQIMNDHFDQYTMVANPTAARLYQANLNRNQNTLTFCEEENNRAEIYSNEPHTRLHSSDTLVRRSTFASSKDWRRPVSGEGAIQHHPFPSIDEASDHAMLSPNDETQQVHANPDRLTRGGLVRRQKGLLNVKASPNWVEQYDTRGSLPDLLELDNTPLLLTREEIARLSSQRRQELLRNRQEAEMIRRNPLRLFCLLFRPEVKTWINRWKLPLFILLTNVVLSVIFYHLLTSTRSDEPDL